VTEWRWSGLTLEATFSTLAQEDQGALSTLAPSGFGWILQDTIFNRTNNRQLTGSISPEEWQSAKASNSTGPSYFYRIRQGKLLFLPTPAADETCAFEYASTYTVLDNDGATYKAYPIEDTDTFVIDYKVVLAGLRWKWKAEKGLAYAEEFARYTKLLGLSKGRDAKPPPLSMHEGCHDARPGIVVPSGNWNL